MNFKTFPFPTCLLAALLLGTQSALVASDVSVITTLSQPEAAVGQPVEFKIEVNGARSARFPDDLGLEGIRIVSSGQSTQIAMHNMSLSMSASNTYVLVAEREGTFQIPSLTVEVGGKTFQTEQLHLKVRGQASHPPPGTGVVPSAPPPATSSMRPEPESVPEDEVAYLQMIVPETEVYVGQVVPVEIRLFLDSRFRFEIGHMPTFSGEGFISEKLSQPVERRQVIDGVTYDVVTFYGAITPVKLGQLEVSPVELAANVLVPVSRGRSRGSIFEDLFGMDPFSGTSTERHQLTLQSNTAELTALPLPKDGRPADFSGAIGNFSLSQKMEPSRGEVGEPMRLLIDVSGQGNFSAIPQPLLESTEGWRTYAGSDRFRPTDSIGFGGTKTFEVTVMPLEEVEQSPSVRFSFFDPATKEYHTLTTSPEPVLVRGGQAPAPTPTPATIAAVRPAEGDEHLEEDLEPDSHREFAPMVAGSPASFLPVYMRSEFLIAHGSALLAFLAVSAFLLLHRHTNSSSGQLQRLRREQAKLLRELESDQEGTRQFYEKAVTFLRNQLVLQKKDPQLQLDEHALVEDPLLTPELREGVSAILRQHEEFQFATGTRSPGRLARDNALSVLNNLHQHYV